MVEVEAEVSYVHTPKPLKHVAPSGRTRTQSLKTTATFELLHGIGGSTTREFVESSPRMQRLQVGDSVVCVLNDRGVVVDWRLP